MSKVEWDYHEFNEISNENSNVKQNQFNNQLVYMASAVARQIHFSASEEKLFAMAISQLDFYANNGDLCVDLKIKDMQEKLGISSSSDYTDLRKQLSKVMDKSYVNVPIVDEESSEEDGDTLEGRLIRSVRTLRKRGCIRVRFDDDFKPALLFCKMAYIKIPLDDTMSYKSSYAMNLQRFLTTMYKTRDGIDPLEQTFDFTTKQLKDMFGLTIDDYVRKDGSFDRFNFEKRTVKVAVNEINLKSQVMQVTWSKKRVKGLMRYFFTCKIATKVKKEPKPYDMTQVEYEKYAAKEEPQKNTMVDIETVKKFYGMD